VSRHGKIAGRLAEHADDGECLAVDPDRLAEHVRIAAEALLPEVVAHDDHLVLARRAFLFEKQPPHRERVAAAHHPRQVGRRDLRAHLFRLVTAGRLTIRMPVTCKSENALERRRHSKKSAAVVALRPP
jgi:hypothetical protein